MGEVEAMIRWKHPEKRLIRPVKFAPFEENGLNREVLKWVLAADDLADSLQARNGRHDLPASAGASASMRSPTVH